MVRCRSTKEYHHILLDLFYRNQRLLLQFNISVHFLTMCVYARIFDNGGKRLSKILICLKFLWNFLWRQLSLFLPTCKLCCIWSQIMPVKIHGTFDLMYYYCYVKTMFFLFQFTFLKISKYINILISNIWL